MRGRGTSTATRTDRAALARAGDEAVEGAIVAVKPGRPTGEPPAPEKVAKLLLHEPRQALPVDQTCYLKDPVNNKSNAHKMPADLKNCAIDCAKAGTPMALVTADGKLYGITGGRSAVPANDATT